MKIDKAVYKKIKRMNREQMNSYLGNLYSKGFVDGTESGKNADFRIRLSQVLNATPGIGIKLYDAAMKTAKEVE